MEISGLDEDWHSQIWKLENFTGKQLQEHEYKGCTNLYRL